MSKVQRERFEPPVTELTTPFWDATREGQLELPWCGACGRAHWYPRRRCPHCHSADIEWRPSTGSGVVYAVSVQHRPGWMGLAERGPYGVALVQLDDGPRMMGGLEGLDPEETAASVGRRVTLAWEDLSDGRRLPMFRVGTES
jgi:uncharacterized OB-fold protein